MLHGLMRYLKNLLLWVICIFLTLTFCCSCNKEYSEFDTELTNILSQKYGILASSSLSLIEAEDRQVLERDPYLHVVFDVYEEKLTSVFDEQFWLLLDVQSMALLNVGEFGNVDWIYQVPESEWPYHANVKIEKMSSELYRVYFNGF